MRVGIVSLLHESNTFISTPTTLDMFKGDKRLNKEKDFLSPSLSAQLIDRVPSLPNRDWIRVLRRKTPPIPDELS